MKEQEVKFDVENEINIVISNKERGVLLDENCCTCINIMLTNEGKIATSFLGIHNDFIIAQLERAQKAYFKELKKALKMNLQNSCEEDCCCGDEHNHKDNCECEHEKQECACGEDCKCEEEDHDCCCGDNCSCK